MSSDIVKIGDLQACRSERKTGYLRVGETAVAVVSIPLAITNGAGPGPTLCISAGVHGCEYSSIEAVMRVLRETEPSELCGTLLTVPVLNMTGFETRGPQGGMSTPFQCPIDSLNLNRIFPGNPEGTMSYQIAAAFMDQIVSKADYYIDCHGGDLNEELVSHVNLALTENPEKDRAVKEVLAASFDCELLKIGEGATGTIGSTSKRYGIPSIVVEAGGYGRLSEEAVQFIVKGINNVMKRLNMIKGIPTPAKKQRIRKPWGLYLKYRGLKPAGSSGPPTTGTNPYAPTDSAILTQFLSNLKDGASLLN